MTVRRKVLFGAVTVAVAIALVEIAARGYARLAHGNTQALTYGAAFARGVLSGTEGVDVETPFVDEREQAAAAAHAFEHRNDLSAADGWVERQSGRQVMAGSVMATVNRNGFRGTEFQPRRQEVMRIGTFGGSFVFGHGLHDADTWPALLEKRLNEAGTRVEVLNFGENGSNIHGLLTNLVRVTKRIELDHVVIVSAYNNHALLRIGRSRSWARLADFYLYNLSIFHVLVKEKLSVLRGQPVDYGLYRQQVVVAPSAVDALIQSYRRSLRSAVQLCRERAIEVVLAAQPQVFFDAQVDARDMFDTAVVDRLTQAVAAGEPLWLMDLEYYLQARFNLELRAIAQEEGARFVDLANLFGPTKADFFIDQIHPNRPGSERIATALASVFSAVGSDGSEAK